MRCEDRLRYASAQPDTARAPTVEIVAGGSRPQRKLKMAPQGDVTLQTASERKTDDAPDEELFGRRKPPQ